MLVTIHPLHTLPFKMSELMPLGPWESLIIVFRYYFFQQLHLWQHSICLGPNLNFCFKRMERFFSIIKGKKALIWRQTMESFNTLGHLFQPNCCLKSITHLKSAALPTYCISRIFFFYCSFSLNSVSTGFILSTIFKFITEEISLWEY